MADNPFDKACRFAAKLNPPGFLGWALDLAAESFTFDGWLDTRGLPFPGDPDRVGDTVARVAQLTAGGQPWAVAIEFQIEPDPQMFGRILEYLGQLWRTTKPDAGRGSRFHVGAAVLNLTGTGFASRDMRWGRLATQLQVCEHNLASESADELLGAIERGDRPRALLPWIPLMTGADEVGMIDRWKRAAEAEPDTRQRSEYAALALVFSDAADREPVWDVALRGWNVRTSKVVDRWKDEARADERAAALVEVLESRFGEVPIDLNRSIRSTASAILLQLFFRHAMEAPSLAEFRTQTGL